MFVKEPMFISLSPSPLSIRGKYGVVYRCKEKSSSGRDVAIKLMLKRHNKKDDVEKEVAIMKRLDHPNLLCFVDYVPDVSNYILVTEL